MISIIKNNIKNAWKTKKTFVILLILVQAISAFSILFVWGAISNDYMGLKENVNSNTYVWLYVDDLDNKPVYYQDIEKMLFEIDEKFNGIYSGIGVSYPYFYSDTVTICPWTKFSIKNGKYVVNDILKREQMMITEGKTFTEKMLNSDNCYSTVRNSEGLYSEKTYSFGGIETEVIGVGKGTNRLEYLTFNPATAKLLDSSCASIIFSLNRIMSTEEHKEFLIIVDKYMGGKYTHELETYSDEDRMAIMRSTFSMSIITAIATIIVLFIIYNYFFTLRRKNYAVFQIMGCTKVKGTLILLGEMMLFSIPSIILGTVSFVICQRKWFNEIFRYMQIAITKDVCIRFALCEIIVVFFLFFLLSYWYSRKSVKSQLATAEE